MHVPLCFSYIKQLLVRHLLRTRSSLVIAIVDHGEVTPVIVVILPPIVIPLIIVAVTVREISLQNV